MENVGIIGILAYPKTNRKNYSKAGVTVQTICNAILKISLFNQKYLQKVGFNKTCK